MNGQQRQKNAGLYRPSFEHDNCGIGAIVNIKGQKSHDTVANALKIVEQLEHRAGKDAEGKTGDGVGILLQISHKFFSKVCKPFGIFLGSERDYGGHRLTSFFLSNRRVAFCILVDLPCTVKAHFAGIVVFEPCVHVARIQL